MPVGLQKVPKNFLKDIEKQKTCLTWSEAKKHAVVALQREKNEGYKGGLRSKPSDSLTALRICNDVCSLLHTSNVNSSLMNLQKMEINID